MDCLRCGNEHEQGPGLRTLLCGWCWFWFRFWHPLSHGWIYRLLRRF